MPRTRTYGLDIDTIRYAQRVKSGSGITILPEPLKQINKFVVGVKKLGAWKLITDIWLTSIKYNSYISTNNAIIYALKDPINNATVYDSTNGIYTKRTIKGINNNNSGPLGYGGGLRVPSYNLSTPMTIWCLASTDRDPALGSQTTNALVMAESYTTNGFRAAFFDSTPDYFHFWTSESGGNIGLGTTTTTVITPGQLHSIFFGVNSSKAFLNFDNTKLSSTTNKNMVDKSSAVMNFGEGGAGKDSLYGYLPFVLFAQNDLEPYYDELYKLVKQTIGKDLGLI